MSLNNHNLSDRTVMLGQFDARVGEQDIVIAHQVTFHASDDSYDQGRYPWTEGFDYVVADAMAYKLSPGEAIARSVGIHIVESLLKKGLEVAAHIPYQNIQNGHGFSTLNDTYRFAYGALEAYKALGGAVE